MYTVRLFSLVLNVGLKVSWTLVSALGWQLALPALLNPQPAGHGKASGSHDSRLTTNDLHIVPYL